MELLIACLVASAVLTFALVVVLRTILRRGRQTGQVVPVERPDAPARTTPSRVETR